MTYIFFVTPPKGRGIIVFGVDPVGVGHRRDTFCVQDILFTSQLIGTSQSNLH